MKTASEVQADRGRFRKGRAKTGGRCRGTPNRASRAWREFADALANDFDAQERLRARVLEQPELLLKIAEHAFGKPRQSLAVSASKEWVITMPPGDDVAED
jgi:hypothetical protein